MGAAPADPSAYTIEFRDDGTVAVRADCNSGTGRFEGTPPQLLITDLSMTEMACPPGSLSDDFVRNLRDVRSFVFRGGQLYLALMADAGIMILSAQALPSDRATPIPG
jgi:heat shock protein HslJ